MARPMDAVLESELSYVTHSGFGHQYESLMRGLVLAAATNRTLIVPPFMGHKNNLGINGAVGCVGSCHGMAKVSFYSTLVMVGAVMLILIGKNMAYISPVINARAWLITCSCRMVKQEA